MKVFLGLAVCLCLVSIGVSMANEELLENNSFFHKLVKRQGCNKPCKGIHDHDCCKGWYCHHVICVQE
uniref:CRP-I 19 n=1 Tax=Mytilus galloprovincialis TaxID=29158 RepID=A0A0A7AD17_MYTGA|nr:CRP-I 19 [Mytilus galloprovincialis]